MSAVPASPTSPDPRSRPSDTSSADSPRCRCSQSTAPGSTEPERVAMTSPSSGVNPIVVSTDRPEATAHSDAPAPRWQVTTRNPSTARPSSSAVRRAAYEWDSPWKPYLRTPISRQAAGSAYVEASGGIVAWNAVSKQATDGRSG